LQSLALVGTAAVVAFFVFPLARVQGALHREQQDLDAHVVES
jgi:hypothetical protein